MSYLIQFARYTLHCSGFFHHKCNVYVACSIIMVLTIVRKLNMNISIECCNRACDYTIVLYVVNTCQVTLTASHFLTTTPNGCDFAIEIELFQKQHIGDGRPCESHKWSEINIILLWMGHVKNGFILPCSILVENRTWSEYDSPGMNWFWLQQRRSVNKGMPNGKRMWWRWHLRWRFACAMFAARTGWPFMQSEQWNEEIGIIIWITSNNRVWHHGPLVCKRFPFKRWVFAISVEKRQWRIQSNHLISLQILSASEIGAENWIDFTLKKAPVRMAFWSVQSRNFVVRRANKSLQIFQSPEH